MVDVFDRDGMENTVITVIDVVIIVGRR